MRKIPKRNKKAKRHKRVIERYHKLIVDSAYEEYYGTAIKKENPYDDYNQK